MEKREAQLCLLAEVPFFQLSKEADKSRLAPQGRCGSSINCEALCRGQVFLLQVWLLSRGSGENGRICPRGVLQRPFLSKLRSPGWATSENALPSEGTMLAGEPCLAEKGHLLEPPASCLAPTEVGRNGLQDTSLNER